MPITAIISQPTSGNMYAAYRPVVFIVRATRTDGNFRPPVVYCDIYINGVYYKTNPKTQYTSATLSDSDWTFDIQDALQEYLTKPNPGENGGANFINDTTSLANVYCKFRSSGYDGSGFMQPEGTAPTPGTGSTPPVPGTGTQSNTFIAVNMLLQHEQNQDVATHLNAYKTGTWNNNVFPLSHRGQESAPYNINLNDSDYFPIINLSGKTISCLALYYKKKGASSFIRVSDCAGCEPASFPSFTLPDATEDVPYSYSVTLVGSLAIILMGSGGPSWMSIGIYGDQLKFTGTPTSGDIGTGESVMVMIKNDCSSTITIYKTINVNAKPACVAVSLSGSIPGTAAFGTPYSGTLTLSGSAPYSLTIINKPSWMSIAIVGGDVKFTGTPDAYGTNLPVEIKVENCTSDDDTYSTTVSVTCTAPTIDSDGMGDAMAGVPYNGYVDVNGTLPITLSDINVPAWVTGVTISGNRVTVTGTPPSVASGVTIAFKINNCGTYAYSTTIDVNAPCQEYYNDSGSTLNGIDYVDCDGTPYYNQTIYDGQNICVQSISGGDFAYLTHIGPCIS